ncbi:MAG: hypothetical protein ACPGWR_32895, partial [Ardenticatenaceae bacterium]
MIKIKILNNICNCYLKLNKYNDAIVLYEQILNYSNINNNKYDNDNDNDNDTDTDTDN